MGGDYFFIMVLLGVALVFPLVPLAMARLWAWKFIPPKPGADKSAAYECGVESAGSAQVQFRAQYFLYGLVFLVFDVETVFLLPLATAFTRLPAGAMVAGLIFLLLVTEGLVWAWWKGLLRWG